MAAPSDSVPEDRSGGSPARRGRTAALVALLVILALGLGLRANAALNPPSLDQEALRGKDSRVYAYLAASLYKRGRWGDVSREQVRNPNDWSPGVPLFIAVTYLVTGGEHPAAARLAIALVSAATIVLAFLLARRLGDWLPGRRSATLAGLAAALAVAVYPIFTTYSRRFFSEPLAAFTLAAAVLSLLWAAERPRPWAWLLPGLWMGLTALVRPEYLIVGAAFAVLAGIRETRRASPARGLAAAGLLAAALIVTLAPWTIRNYVELHRLVPVSTGGGKALFIGTYLPGRGSNIGTKVALLRHHPALVPARYRRRPLRYRDIRRVDLDPVLKDFANRRYPGVERDAALARLGRSNLRRYALGQPPAYAGMIAAKTWGMWRRPSGTSPPVTWVALHLAVVALGLLGLGLLAPRRPWCFAALVTVLLCITAVSAITLAPPRRTLPLVPLLASTGGVAVVWMAAGAGRAARQPRLRSD